MKEGGTFATEGILMDRYGRREGWVTSEDGRITGMGNGACPEEPDVTGFILADIVNMHTHCADCGLKIPAGISLEQLVAPPDGLKHRYLRSCSDEELLNNMRVYADCSAEYGSRTFVDFREGGAHGCRLLRQAVPDAVILGRPESPEFDPEEIEDILGVADGIGISSISDMDPDYVERIADVVREKRKIFAIHVSERRHEDIDLILSMDPAFIVHMCEATFSDMAKCAEAEVPLVVCPTSNRYFGKQCPIARAQSNGVDLALGTDNAMLCMPDMISEAGEFARMAEAQNGDPESSLDTLARVSGKILNAVQSNMGGNGTGPVTVLPAPSLDVREALANRDQRTILNQEKEILR